MKRAIFSLMLSVALVSALSVEAESVQRMVLGELFSNTS